MIMTDLSIEIFNPIDSGMMARQRALKVIEKSLEKPKPTFTREFSGFDALKKRALELKNFNNIVVIGNGGSITSFSAFYDALIRYNIKEPKKCFVLNNMEPDIINHIKDRFDPKDTLVIAISKSGNTVGVLESLFSLTKYKILTITTKSNGALWKITQEAGWPYLEIPNDIGGRFSGRTQTGYFPSYLMDIDIEGIEQGARSVTEFYLNNIDLELNLPLQLAYHHYLLENAKYPQLYLSIYSQRLFGFYPLIIQLIHETFGKQGKGLTVFGGQGPEAQHHTNQRFFGGIADTHGLFITVDDQETDAYPSIPDDLKELKLSDSNLGLIDKISLGQSVFYESQGVIDTAKDKNIPYAHMRISKITPSSVGQLLAFFHFYVYYSALFRGVDPFDQPAVEDSKKLSFKMRKNRK